jgi:hypothetical protein
MRIKIFWLAFTCAVSLFLIGASVAQPPPGAQDKKDGFGKKGKKGGLTADDMVERIMSFAKNNSGKVTKDDLPERLQYLIEMGDTNKDGFLDREEVKALAAKLAQQGPGNGFGKGGKGKGGPPKDGFGPKGAALDQRLADLEERLETMLLEVKDLRTMLAKKGPPKGPKGDGGDSNPKKGDAPK